MGREVSRKRKRGHGQYEAWGAAGIGCGLRVKVRSGVAGVPPGGVQGPRGTYAFNEQRPGGRRDESSHIHIFCPLSC